MQPLLTPAEMRAADEAAISAGTPQSVLMDRAGGAVAREALRMLGSAYGRRVVVLAGPGNNGGDGRVAVQRLAQRGVRCDVVDIEKATHEELHRALGRADLVIDAMYGTGCRGALTGLAEHAAQALAARRLPVLAVDIPSGVHGGSGAISGVAVPATRTLTFQARKVGMCFGAGRVLSGNVVVADIGIDVGECFSPTGPRLALVEDSDIPEWIPVRPLDAHKWTAAVMVVGGSAGMHGAPMFAARAALRAGAGMVTCGLPERVAEHVDSGECIVRVLPSDPTGAQLVADAAHVVLDGLHRYGAVVLGPGLGADARTSEMVARIVAEAPVPLVVDADGLNAIAGDLSPLRLRAQQLGAPAILTPHAGEYQRLTGQSAHPDPVAAARSLAAETRAIVLLKGPTTVVAAPDGRAYCITSAGPELATAGTGDVLSGIIGAFVARGATPWHAAAAGAHVHGRAGARVGAGLIASDLIAAIPPTLTELFSKE